MNVKNCILGIQSGSPMMAVVFNGVAGGYILSVTERVSDDLIKDLEEKYLYHIDFDRVLDRYTKLRNYFKNSEIEELNSLKDPSIFRKSGKFLCSCLFPSYFNYVRDSVIIHNGIMLTGFLSKSTLSCSENSIVHKLASTSMDDASHFIDDAQMVFDYYLQFSSLTLGLQNYRMKLLQPNFEEEMKEVDIVVRKIEEIKKYSSISEQNHLENVAQSYISRLLMYQEKALNNYQDKSYSLNIYANKSGARGDKGSITNVDGCVGQQFYNNVRFNINNKFLRTTPYSEIGDNGIEAHGFTKQGYFQGLNPMTNVYAHMASRLAIICQYLKTPEAGKIARELTVHLTQYIDKNGMVRGFHNKLFSINYYNDASPIFESIIRTPIGKIYTVFDVDSILSELGFMNPLISGLEELSIQESLMISNEVYKEFDYENKSNDIYFLAICLIGKKIKKNKMEKLIETLRNKYISTRISIGRPIGVDTALSLSQPLTQIMLKTQHQSSKKTENTENLFKRLTIVSKKPSDILVHPSNKFLTRAETKELAESFEFTLFTDILIPCIGNSFFFVLEGKIDKTYKNLYDEIDSTNKHYRLTLDKRKMMQKNIKYATVVKHLVENLTIVPLPLTLGFIDMYPSKKAEPMKNLKELFQTKIIKGEIEEYSLVDVSGDMFGKQVKVTKEEYKNLTGNESETGGILIFLNKDIVINYPAERLAKICNTDPKYYCERTTTIFTKKFNLEEAKTNELYNYTYIKFFAQTVTYKFMSDTRLDHSKTFFCSPIEMMKWFGIEAARCSLEFMFRKVYENSSYTVSNAHFETISNYILSGKPRQINNYAFKAQRRGFFENILFDNLSENICEAGCFKQKVSINNAETSVLSGKKINIGTGYLIARRNQSEADKLTQRYLDYSRSNTINSKLILLMQRIVNSNILKSIPLRDSGNVPEVLTGEPVNIY